ncbi:MAG: hypothetical protein IPM85_18340 [Chitinophagaceae bacterium]|nr:hypothetical protein [Chitinophagaceae bacterium]
MKKSFILLVAASLFLICTTTESSAQQYKLRQVNNMMGMKSESTIYVKGMRKRTESAGMMGMPAQPITIEQCDLQRTIYINDKKKLYYIEPFSKETVEMMQEEEKLSPLPKTKNQPQLNKLPKEKANIKKGGIIYMYNNITDTGERKKMYGFTARHVWTTMKMKPSANACTMKDSFMIKTDGWYIDLPEFNCPVNARPDKMMQRPQEKGMNEEPEKKQPECIDSFVSKKSGKGKLGFPLMQTTIMKFGGGQAQKSEMETSLETLEFSTAKLDSMLFEIPLGYTEAKSEEELQDKFDIGDMMKGMKNKAKNNENNPAFPDQKQAGHIRVGVLQPAGDEQVNTADLQQGLAGVFTSGNIEAVAVSSADEAKSLKCEYLLNTQLTKIKQAGKVGSILKAIKNADPNAVSSFNIEANMKLTTLSDGSIKTQQKAEGKYEGKINDATAKALEDGGRKVLEVLD